jgi:Glycosyltransferase family 87
MEIARAAGVTESRPRAAMAALASGLIAFAAGWVLAAFFLPHQYPDFGVFWTAGRHAFDPRLYDGAYLTAAQSWWPGMTPHPFVYPPTFLLLAWPFGQLPFTAADYLWGGLSCAALVLAARQIVRPAWAALILPLCVPMVMAAAYGQSIFFAGAALVAGLALIERRPWLAGVLIAVAVCLKPQVAILAPLAMLGASWRVAAGAAAASGALFLGSLVFGIGHWFEWLAALPRFTDLIREMRLPTVNLLQSDLPAPEKLLVVVAGVGFAAWSVRQSPAQRIVGVVCGSLCCASYAVRPDLAVLAPSALAWALSGRTLAAWLRRLAGGALLLGMVATPFGIALFMLASVGAALLEPAQATGARLTAPWPRWRPAPGLSAGPQ